MRSSGSIVNAVAAAIPAAHHQRPLVVGIDQADQVAEDDAVLVAEARARQQHRRVAGIADVDRQAGRHQLGSARLQDQRRVDAGAQVEAGAAGGGVGRQPPGHARVEDADVDAGHGAARARFGAAAIRVAISATSWRASASLPARASSRAPSASIRVSALSSWPKVAGPRLPTISGTFFFSRLALALARTSPLSAAKPTQKGGAASAATDARMSGFSTSANDGTPCPATFLILAVATLATRQSATAAVATKTSLSRRRGQGRGVHLLGGRHVDAAHVARRRERDRAGDQRDVGAGLGGGAGDREAHLAARAVAEAAHRIDRLERRPGGDEDAPAGEQLGLEERDHLGEQLVGLEHPAVAEFAARLVAVARAEHGRAVGGELGEVALRRRMGPHLAVHRRRDQQRAALDRPRQAEQREQIVGAAMQQLGDEVGARRCDQHRVGLAREVDVRHVVGFARIPLAGVDGAVGERLQRHRGDELLGRLGHHDLHRRPGLDQRPRQLGRLVAGDAARQAEHDVAAREFGGGWCETRMFTRRAGGLSASPPRRPCGAGLAAARSDG